MASRELGGVVDPKLVVYGTANLRVCDASVFPMQIGTMPMTTIYAIALPLLEERSFGLMRSYDRPLISSKKLSKVELSYKPANIQKTKRKRASLRLCLNS
jgi:hypothetical protein